MNSMTQAARIVKPGVGSVKPGYARPVNMAQILRAMSRAKKPFQGCQVELTEAGMAACEPVALPAIGADCPGCGSGIAAIGQALCSECSEQAATRNDDELMLHEQIAEVKRRYGAPTPEGDHLIFRGTVTGDYAKVSLPTPGESLICILGSRVSLPKVAFEMAARLWMQHGASKTQNTESANGGRHAR